MTGLTLYEKGAPSVTFDTADGKFTARLAGVDVTLTRHAAVGLMMGLQQALSENPSGSLENAQVFELNKSGKRGPRG